MMNAIDILNAHILIVDDQAVNIQLLTQMLQDAGYQHITSTMDPQTVCTLHRAHAYDLILLDLQMPVMDGFQVMAELKAITTDSYVPILVITAQPNHKLRALASGAKDFVAKPFDLVEVKTRIHNLLEVRLLYKQLEHNNQILTQTVEERTAELRESEARFRRLTELASDWYWEQDSAGHFTKTHGPALEMLDIPADTQISATDPVPPENWSEAQRIALAEKMAAREPFLDFVYSRINANNEKEYLQVSGEPIFDVSGRFIGYRGIGKNISEMMAYITNPQT